MAWAMNCFRKSIMQGRDGAPAEKSLDSEQLAWTENLQDQSIHQRGVQLVGAVLPYRVHGGTEAHLCRPSGTHQGRGWEATRFTA